MSAACTITPSSKPEVSTATCRLRPLTFFAASQPRGPPFLSSSRSGCRSRPRSGSAHGPPARAASSQDDGGSPPTRLHSRTRACTRTPFARAGRTGVAAGGATDSRFARGRRGRPAAAACRSCAADRRAWRGGVGGGGGGTAGLGGRDQGREQGVLLVAERLPGAEVADKGPVLCCPHGVPPRRAATLPKPPARPLPLVIPLHRAGFSNGLLVMHPASGIRLLWV